MIAFEGIDGCGKSTQHALAADWLRARGCDVVATREPTDGAWGRRIRAMARSGEQIPPEEELRWFVEDRREHVEGEIRPALARGATVLCDRYTLSSVAYQGARGLDPRQILEQGEREFPLPDCALLFELPLAEALARVSARSTRGDAPSEPAFEERDFLRRVAAIFASLDRPYLLRIDARGSAQEVAARVRPELERAALKTPR